MSGSRLSKLPGAGAAHWVALAGGVVCALGLAAAVLTSLTYAFGPCPTFSEACGVVAAFQVGPGTDGSGRGLGRRVVAGARRVRCHT